MTFGYTGFLEKKKSHQPLVGLMIPNIQLKQEAVLGAQIKTSSKSINPLKIGRRVVA